MRYFNALKLKVALAGMATWLLFGGLAQAITLLEFEATDLLTIGDPFGTIGIAPQKSMFGCFSYDPSAMFVSGPTDDGALTREVQPQASFIIDVGPRTLTGFLAECECSDAITISDALIIGDVDRLRVISDADRTFSHGVILDRMELLVLANVDENIF